MLNADFTVIEIINWEEAFILSYIGKANVIEYYDKFVRSAHQEYPVPAVIRRKRYIKLKSINPSRRNIFLRDKGICQYCGGNGSTIDHIQPRSQLKERSLYNTFSNMVACCISCNRKKGTQVWTPNRIPKRPNRKDLLDTKNIPNEWKPYL